jgi:pimeloyl-ACP methyl ester carboxylesterase
MTRFVVACLAATLFAHGADASDQVPITIRGKALTLQIYQPPAAAARKGTVLMGSGDVGWVGLAVDLAGFLSGQGYTVVGINSRQYLSAFTEGSSHVTTDQVTGDYAAFVRHLRGSHALLDPIIVAGVSEGAALAVLAGAAANHTWVRGVMTMGLPPTAELAWRWKDMLSWITKKDSGEPVFEPKQFIGGVSPVPLWMIQSTTDEYVTEADFRTIERAARAPKRLMLVDAKNHRFTDRLPLLRQGVLEGLVWMQNPR